MAKKALLMILDGWGIGNHSKGDVIYSTPTPYWDYLMSTYPHSELQASGENVGLPDGQMGNSEVGHLNIGAGRVVYQDLVKINKACSEGTILENPEIKDAFSYAQKTGKAMHFMGLTSNGGVHSSLDHLFALCDIAKHYGLEKVYIHCFMDGRDTDPRSGIGFIKELQEHCAKSSGVIASIVGRYYAMDRDKRWDRVEKAYDNMVLADGKRYENAVDAIKASYADKVSDEFVVPCVIGDYHGFEDGDAVLMANFRADRAREILYALADKTFDGFARKKVIDLSMAVGMTEYSVDHNRFMQTMFPPEALTHIFGEVIAEHGLSQLRIAETEKYAHVTFFFNGGEEKEFAGESRILVPSPKVATYDLKPEMSVYEVTEHLVDAIENQKFDVIICNFANGDMVGHTGIMEAALKAVAAVDDCLGKVVKAIKDVDGVLLVTADHGNAEKMVDEKTGQPYTAHTVGDVQAVLVNGPKDVTALDNGKLADISPTLLDLLKIEKPAEMTGKSLLVRQ